MKTVSKRDSLVKTVSEDLPSDVPIKKSSEILDVYFQSTGHFIDQRRIKKMQSEKIRR